MKKQIVESEVIYSRVNTNYNSKVLMMYEECLEYL